MKLLAAVMAAFVIGAGTGIVAGSSAVPSVHLQPGQEVTVIADTPAPSIAPTDSPQPTPIPTPVPTPNGPACNVTISGQNVTIWATGLMPGNDYGMWWGVYRSEGGTRFYMAGTSLQTAWEGSTYWIYPLRTGFTEVHVYPAPLALTYADAEARQVAHCEYSA